VKKVSILFILLFLFLLCSCNVKDDTSYRDKYFNNDINEEDIKQIDGEFINGAFHFEIDYVQRYYTFDEMQKDKNAQFVYGRIITVSDMNGMIQNYEFEVINSNCIESFINILTPKDANLLKINNIYVIHIIYNKEYNYYSLTQGKDSVFILKNGKFEISDNLKSTLDDKSLLFDQFLNIIFSNVNK